MGKDSNHPPTYIGFFVVFRGLPLEEVYGLICSRRSAQGRLQIMNDVSYIFGKFVTFNRRGLGMYFKCELAITSSTYCNHIVYSITAAEKMNARLASLDAVKHSPFHKMTVGGG